MLADAEMCFTCIPALTDGAMNDRGFLLTCHLANSAFLAYYYKVLLWMDCSTEDETFSSNTLNRCQYFVGLMGFTAEGHPRSV